MYPGQAFTIERDGEWWTYGAVNEARELEEGEVEAEVCMLQNIADDMSDEDRAILAQFVIDAPFYERSTTELDGHTFTVFGREPDTGDQS